MPHAALDAALIHIMGAVNVVVFRISRRRVVPSGFSGIPHARLTEVGQVPELDSPLVGYLRDGDDLVLLVPERAPEPRWLRDMRNATNVTLEIQEGTSRSAISIVGEGEADAEEAQRLREQVRDSATTRELNAHVSLIRETEQAEVTAGLLKGATLNERYEVRKQRLIPFVRLKTH